MSLVEFIQSGSQGGNLLFCGAGFSANCLNFNSDELGTAWPLMKALNERLNYEFVDMQVAADEFVENFGEHSLLSLLEEKYSVCKRTNYTDTILKYPWSRIYTTNYDDLISQTLINHGVRHYVANNSETPQEIRRLVNHERWVVHLHGALKKWDINNFAKSCVLGRESYLKASSNSNWDSELRKDYRRAKSVFFIGFSNSDFYLAEHLYSAEASRDKVYFINSEQSSQDRELIAKQKKFGEPLAIGTEQFSEIISEQLAQSVQSPLKLYNFEACDLPETIENRASAEQQYAFMVSGKESPPAHYKDIEDDSKSYRTPRIATEAIGIFLKQDRAVGMVIGGLCSGKSVIFEECIMNLLIAGNTVFRLRSKFTDLIDEIEQILKENPNCTIAIDDCYSLRENFDNVIKRVNNAGAKILLASRTLAFDAAPDITGILSKDTPFCTFNVDILDNAEGGNLIECTDRIGGWGAKVSTYAQKRRILEIDKNSRLAGFLLGVFQADHIRTRFKSELDLFRTNGFLAEKTLIIALYLKSIGGPVKEEVLSELLNHDSLKIIKDAYTATSTHDFISYNPKTKNFELIASINARDALKNLFDPKLVTSSIIEAIQNMERVRHEPEYKHIFSQFMRYTQLQLVIDSFDEQDRFFDRLSEIYFCKNHVLFWLQWSMAMREHKQFTRANQYLDEAYGRAVERNFDTNHLDDQKAGLLLDSIRYNASSVEYFRCFRESCTLLNKMISAGADTPHNYQTIGSFRPFFEKAGEKIETSLKPILQQDLAILQSSVQKQLDLQHDGFAKVCMEEAIESIEWSKKTLDGTPK